MVHCDRADRQAASPIAVRLAAWVRFLRHTSQLMSRGSRRYASGSGHRYLRFIERFQDFKCVNDVLKASSACKTFKIIEIHWGDAMTARRFSVSNAAVAAVLGLFAAALLPVAAFS